VDYITALPTCGPAQVSPNEETPPCTAHSRPGVCSTYIDHVIRHLGRPAALACDYEKWRGSTLATCDSARSMARNNVTVWEPGGRMHSKRALLELREKSGKMAPMLSCNT
jgi:hypothetical protein